MQKKISFAPCEEFNLMTYEEDCYYKANSVGSRASYVQRNKAMIDNSDICIFYFNKNYYNQISRQE